MTDRCPVCGRMLGPAEPCFHPPAPERPSDTLARLVMGGVAGWLIAAFVFPVLMAVALLCLISDRFAAVVILSVLAVIGWRVYRARRKKATPSPRLATCSRCYTVQKVTQTNFHCWLCGTVLS